MNKINSILDYIKIRFVCDIAVDHHLNFIQDYVQFYTL